MDRRREADTERRANNDEGGSGPGRHAHSVLITHMVVRPQELDRALAVFRDVQADVRANEPGAVFYQYYRDQAEPTVFWVHEVFVDEEAKREHLGRHGQRRADFDAILAEPPVFHEVIEL
jgi:quinol monooxygenase YgiN